MRDRTFYKRQFLNTEEDGGVAFIEARVTEPDNERGHFDAELKIGDCSRIASLDFDVFSDEAADNVRVKLRRLRQTVLAFEKAVLAALDDRDSK